MGLKERIAKLAKETAPLDRKGLVQVPARIIIPGRDPQWSWVDPEAPRIIILKRDDRRPAADGQPEE